MALVLDEDQGLIQDTAREFCTARAPVSQLRTLRDTQDALGYSADVWREMAELGWAGIVIPEAHGGTGFGWQALGVILEETGRTLTASPLYATVMLGAAALLRGGSDAQRADLLPRVAAGELTFALALEESGQHSPWGSALTAKAGGDGHVLDGEKTFVIDGHSADTLVVVARTSGTAGERDGLTLFLVPGDAEGVTRTRTVMADARNAARIAFDGVRVGADAVIGRVDAGAEILDPVLDGARIGMAAEMLGTATEAFERTVAYLKERKQFGELIGSFQGLKHRAADAFTELQLSRSVVMDALTALDEDRDDVPLLASLAKARMGETLNLISREAIQMHGGIGMTDEYEIGFFLKRARIQEATFGGERFHRDRYAALSGY
ncbi:MAG: acyl-CoA dehydrogenase family protein [Pseudomonadales bacterium]|jgi:acyl-CoA dehydrogenase|nr:acyl-CoA dehydrogenase family protein [Pseudomonadales bacterium]